MPRNLDVDPTVAINVNKGRDVGQLAEGSGMGKQNAKSMNNLS